jgi:hypothetical protein
MGNMPIFWQIRSDLPKTCLHKGKYAPTQGYLNNVLNALKCRLDGKHANFLADQV